VDVAGATGEAVDDAPVRDWPASVTLCVQRVVSGAARVKFDFLDTGNLIVEDHDDGADFSYLEQIYLQTFIGGGDSAPDKGGLSVVVKESFLV